MTRTAGRSDRPEAPPATPAFILLFFLSSEKRPEDENPPLRSLGNSGPDPACTCWEGQGLCPSRNRGTQGLTRPYRGYDRVCPLPAWPREAFPYQQHRNPGNRRTDFLLSVFGPWPQSGSGLLPGNCVGGRLPQAKRSACPTRGWVKIGSSTCC